MVLKLFMPWTPLSIFADLCASRGPPPQPPQKKNFQQKVRITLSAHISTYTLVRDLNPRPDYQTFTNLVSHFLKLYWVFLSISEISVLTLSIYYFKVGQGACLYQF